MSSWKDRLAWILDEAIMVIVPAVIALVALGLLLEVLSW